MYRIGKTFTFDAAHQLLGLPKDHKCGRMHGHTYKVELTFVGSDLRQEGWLFDYGDLSKIRDWIRLSFDHHLLNERIPRANPTAENLAKFIYDQTKAFMDAGALDAVADNSYLEKVRVQETPNTFAEYFGD